MEIWFIQLSDDAYILITKKMTLTTGFVVRLTYKIVMLNSDNIDQYYCFYCIFDQLKAALLSISNVKKNIWTVVLKWKANPSS